MHYLLLAIGFVLVLAIVWFFVKDAQYYNSIFNDRHYTEIYSWLKNMLDRGEVETSSFDDGTAIVTSGRLVMAYTRDLTPEIDLIHISMSQGKRVTTQAVGGRILYLLLTALESNRCAIDVFKTQTSVHHIELNRERNEERNWTCNELDFILQKMQAYKPFPIRLMQIDSSGIENG